MKLVKGVLVHGGGRVENHNVRQSSNQWSPLSLIELILFHTFCRWAWWVGCEEIEFLHDVSHFSLLKCGKRILENVTEQKEIVSGEGWWVAEQCNWVGDPILSSFSIKKLSYFLVFMLFFFCKLLFLCC